MSQDFRQKISSYIDAGYPALYVVTPEEARIERELRQIVKDEEDQEVGLCYWSTTEGLVRVEPTTGKMSSCEDPLAALEEIEKIKDPNLIILRDYHFYLKDAMIIRKMKDLIKMVKKRGVILIFISIRIDLPPELEKEITVIEYELPDKESLGDVLDGVIASASQLKLDMKDDERQEAIESALGMTTSEAENAFAKSLVDHRKFDPKSISAEKAQVIKKSGLLEFFETKEDMDSVGGHDLLKEWLRKRKRAFSKEAKKFGLPMPRGILLTGIPGCGKSLVAKAASNDWKLPLLRFDVGKTFGSLVGESEKNMRNVIQTAEAVAPCILWLEEIDKAFAGVSGSGSLDSGTTKRVFGSFLTWMQEKKQPVFVVATANDVNSLPPELLRKGRFDEIFFVDLPSKKDRADIWSIHIGKYNRDPRKFDVMGLASKTEEFSGSEIEEAVISALYEAFDDDEEDLTMGHLLHAIEQSVPLAVTRKEQISDIRKWAVGRARLTSSSVYKDPTSNKQRSIKVRNKKKKEDREEKKN